MIAVSDFTEVKPGGLYPVVGNPFLVFGDFAKARFFRDGVKHGAAWRPEDLRAELTAIADETGLPVQFRRVVPEGVAVLDVEGWASDAPRGWLVVQPRLRGQ